MVVEVRDKYRGTLLCVASSGNSSLKSILNTAEVNSEISYLW